MNNLKIRKAMPHHFEVIALFQVEMALETEGLVLDPQIVENGVKAILADSSKGCYYIAEIDGKITASLLITYEWSDWRNATVYWLQSVYVVKEFRQQGIFKALYGHIRNQVNEDPSVAGIRLYADKSNFSARKVYEKMGLSDEHYTTYEWMK
ncbi:MAG TPA: GNAT family N-acetyltransferase [Bacteroidales bacterium]|nr:GNAT family N-acetyltransferase [Bacteroidales bacterium]HPT02572.1 GNAT family N-acetyltransferase [Bacteroidales bacterium]